jgi:hydroxysqualene synthase
MPTMSANNFRSGKSHRDENFPVASRLIHPRHRGTILAFYNFVRTADDIADHSTLDAQNKLELLDQLEQGLLGASEANPEAVALRLALSQRGLSACHAQNLLTAFRMDVTKLRYRDWDDLLDYCSYSAMPVGRFVLDVHGEDSKTWPASDALCAALQVINHIQDCKQDYTNLDRVYIPMDAFASAGTEVAALGEARASPALARCLHGLARRTHELLRASDPLPVMVEDFRLSLEILVIQSLAYRLTRILELRDPLSERVHVSGAGAFGVASAALISGILRRVGRRLTAGSHRPRNA